MDLDQTTLLQVRTKQVDLLYGQLRRETFAGIACALVTGVLIAQLASVWLLLGWMAGASTLYLIFLTIGRSFHRTSSNIERTEYWYRLFIGMTLACGAVWGAFGVGIALADNQLVFGLTMFCIGCLALSLVYFTGGSVAAVGGFAGLALLPPALIALLDPNTVNISLSFMLVTVFALATTGAFAFKPVFWEALLLRSDNEQLTNHLAQRRTQIEKLNIALKTNLDKREAVELNLRRNAADLGLAEGKAKALAETLERVSPYCSVTGLLNRRTLLELLEKEWRRCLRDRRHLTLVVVTIDHYAEYVDTYGNRSADAVLKRIADAIKTFGKRAGDLTARYGNDQFALLLPGADAANGQRIAEAIRARIEGQKIAHASAPQRGHVTIHAGVVTMIPVRNMNHEELLKRIDTSVYEARFQGGNRVVAYKPLDKIKVNHWSRNDDGPLNEQSLIQKLLLWGFDTKRSVLRPGSSLADMAHDNEIVYALLTGRMLFTIEGSQLEVEAGDCVFIPGGTTCQAEVYGDDPVLSFVASRPD